MSKPNSVINSLVSSQTLMLPMNAVMSDEDMAALQNIDESSVGETFELKQDLRLKPDWLVIPGKDGFYLPVFTEESEIPDDYYANFTWLSTTFDQCIKLFEGKEGAIAIVVNPFTKPIELRQEAVNYAKTLMSKADEQKTETLAANGDKVSRFIEYCRAKYSDELGIADERSYCYKSLPICIIDCVYSLRARYNSVTVPIVERYADKFLNGNKTADDESDNLDRFVENMMAVGLKNFADNIAKNHQVLGGEPKERVCLNIALALQKLGINTLQDFQEYPSRAELAEAIRSIKGIGAAGVNYLFMLTGDDNKSKPDVHIHHCIAEACGEDASDAECQEIIEKAAAILKSEFPTLTVRKLDGIIWRDFSSRD